MGFYVQSAKVSVASVNLVAKYVLLKSERL